MDEDLKKLGFSEKEALVYKTILEYGKILPTTVSGLTGINRTTVYAISKELVKKGLIAEDLAGRSTYLTALPPERLLSMVLREENEIKAKRQVAKDAAEGLSAIISKEKYSVPKIRFVEEESIEHFLYEQMEKWFEASKTVDGICWGFQDHSFAERYSVWVKWAADKFSMPVNLVSNKSKIEKDLKALSYKNRSIRFGLPGADFSASLWVVGSYIVMIRTRERPYYLVEIHDAPLAHNLRELFKNIWVINGEGK
jgi:sugar-specific transcriptional regulator TrmB